jgi:hypothetical protein
MGGSVVEHEVHVKIGRHLAVDQVEEGADLLTAVPLAAGANHLSRLHIQGGEQIGRAVTHVIMGPSLDLARSHRQHRSGALEGLDLGLFIHAQNQSAIGRSHVETDDVANLVNEQRIAR